MYYSYVEIEYVATSFSPARTDSALKLLKRSGGVVMMVMNLASPLERLEGFRPAHCRRKAYSLARGILPHQSNML